MHWGSCRAALAGAGKARRAWKSLEPLSRVAHQQAGRGGSGVALLIVGRRTAGGAASKRQSVSAARIQCLGDANATAWCELLSHILHLQQAAERFSPAHLPPTSLISCRTRSWPWSSADEEGHSFAYKYGARACGRVRGESSVRFICLHHVDNRQ